MTSQVRLGPLTVQYVAAGEPLPESRRQMAGFEESDDRLIQASSSIRRILMPLPGGRFVYLLLHWCDRTDLATLDELVATEKDCAGMFEGALTGSVMTVGCAGCLAKYRAVVADAGNPLFVFDDLTARLRSHSYVLVCPRCGRGMQPHVMEILREISNGH